MAAATSAVAADSAANEAGTEVEAVVVTGIRASLGSAQQVKRNAEQVVDSISAVDIGALPDRSVSEALQRIPGITLQRTNENRDPARLAGEGGQVFIRGLSWVRSELNGRDVFSANNGRGLSFEDVSADLLAGVDVYKNPSAEMIEGGVGGIVNLRTRLPFDTSGRLIAASGDYNYGDLYDKGFASGNLLISDRWQTGAGEIGALFSASLSNVGNRTDSIQTGRFEPWTIGGETRYVPNSIGWRRIDWEQKRTAFMGALQWQPSNDLLITAQAFYSKADPHDIEHALGDVQGGFPNGKLTNAVYGADGVIESGTLQGTQLDADTRFGSAHKTTGDYSLNLKYNPNANWAFSADVQYVDSRADILSMTAFTELGGLPYPNLDFDLRGDNPSLALVPNGVDRTQDSSAYWWAAAMDHLEKNTAHEWSGRADTEYTFTNDSWLKSFKVGVRYTDKQAITRQTGWNWSLLSQQFWGGGGGPAVYVDGSGSNAELFGYDNFFRGKVQLPGVAWFPADALVSNGTAHAYDFLKTTETSGWGWTPLSGDFNAANPGADNPNAGVNTQGERTYAAYGVLRFGSDNLSVPIDGNIGLRVVRTEASGVGVLTVTPPQGSLPGCLAQGTVDCTPFANALIFSAVGRVDNFEQKNSYTNVLPSFNIRFRLSDDVQLRFAASEAMVRPNFSQMMPYTTLSYTFTPTLEPDPFTPRTGVGGNTQLKPTTADQYDASLEWYFAPTGSLTFAAFYKNIKNYIFLGQDQETYTFNGVTQTFEVTRNMNGDHGSIGGFEVAYQQFFDFLPGALSGLGLQANFTFIDSNGGRNTAVNILEPAQVTGAGDNSLPLEGMSRTSYNIAAMYEKYGVSARLAYNWRERYLLTTSAANIQRPVWSEDYGQLDGSIFYSINEHIKVGVEGTNLLNSRTYLDVGGSTLAPRYSWTDTDRRFAAAVRAVW
jgi:TonB-dependent receptor